MRTSVNDVTLDSVCYILGCIWEYIPPLPPSPIPCHPPPGPVDGPTSPFCGRSGPEKRRLARSISSTNLCFFLSVFRCGVYFCRSEGRKTAYFHTTKVYTEKVYTETGTGKNKDFQTKCASTGVSRRPDIGFILACYRLCLAVGLVRYLSVASRGDVGTTRFDDLRGGLVVSHSLRCRSRAFHNSTI